MPHSPFPYSTWLKKLGFLLIPISILNFFYQANRKGTADFNELAVGLSFAFLFIFFSKENKDDEMIHHLKFKALTRSIIVTFTITHLYNYLFLNWRYSRPHDLILSISAYQFLALTLIIATAIFYFLRYQITHPKEHEELH